MLDHVSQIWPGKIVVQDNTFVFLRFFIFGIKSKTVNMNIKMAAIHRRNKDIF